MGAGLAAQMEACPTGTRLLAALYAAATCGMAALQGPMAARAQLHFICSLATVVNRKYFWAVLTSAFYRPLQDTLDFMMAAIELQMAADHLAERERELGSTRFLAWAALTAGLANAAFLAFMKGLSNSGTKGAYYVANQGLWPLVTVCMTLRALERPDAMVKVFNIAEVPGRWYPFSFAVGLSALRGSMQWDMLASIAVGHAYRHFGLEALLLPGRRFAAWLESRWPPRGRGPLGALLGGAWVPAEPGGGSGWGGGDWGGAGSRGEPRAGGEGSRRGPAAAEPRLFSGPGRRLGD